MTFPNVPLDKIEEAFKDAVTFLLQKEGLLTNGVQAELEAVMEKISPLLETAAVSATLNPSEPMINTLRFLYDGVSLHVMRLTEKVFHEQRAAIASTAVAIVRAVVAVLTPAV